jgi:DNA-binding NarL/FixJ family response regulator
VGDCDMAEPGAGIGLILPDSTRCVLALLARGLGTIEVAERLNVPPEVVRRDVADAMTFLGARSKLELIVKAVRLGLIDLT